MNDFNSIGGSDLDDRPRRPVAWRAAPAWAASRRTAVVSVGDKAAPDPAAPSAWIVDIARTRSRDSFALLFEHFAPRVKSYLLRLGARPDQAEELAQEALLTVWRKAAYYDPARAAASTWIFTIARNLRSDAIRRERHPEDLEHEPELLPAAPQSADDAVSAGERVARVRAAIEGLSSEQAEVVRLSYFHDKAHSEISAALGLPLGTVKSRLRLAMTRLRAQLEGLL